MACPKCLAAAFSCISEVRWLFGPVGTEVPQFSVTVWCGLDPGVPAAVRGATGRGAPRWRIRVVVAGVVLVFLVVEAHADVALQRGRCEPLLGQAALEERDA